MKPTSVLLAAVSLTAMASAALAACPAATVADMKGLSPAYPQQFELAEFQDQASCALTFSENGAIGDLNGRIQGNPELPALAERLPEEPLVVAPYREIGTYGGVLNGTSKATEAGSSDMLSLRHVNLVRYADDLKTLVPNIAKSWEWNDDFTQLTFKLRKGHKWSDGAPFTAEDVVFWYEGLILNKDVYEETPARWLSDGEPMKVEALDDVTVRFTIANPTPGLVARFGTDYGQPFQPKHILGRYVGAEADANAKADGFETAAAAISHYYGGSDWKDVPSPLLKDSDMAAKLPHAVVPTLESHVLVEESSEGRRLVANPYFHMVDTTGQQLPYINEYSETYVADRDVQNLRIMDGKIDWKQQAIGLVDFPLLKENEGKGNYTVGLSPTVGETVFYGFNRTHKDPVLREIFNDIRFNEAMSVALNRDEINELVYLGQGTPEQVLPAAPETVNFVTDEMKTFATEYDPEKARALLDEMGLKDSDGDGTRERPDGKPLVIRIVFSNQGTPAQIHEMARGYWADVGVRADIREVTSDEYRSGGNNGDLDVVTWKQDGIAGPVISQDPTMMVPSFGEFFNPGNATGWATWINTSGAEGVEPPEWAKEMAQLGKDFIRFPMGSAESDEIGGKITQLHVENLVKIGLVGQVLSPWVHNNRVHNVVPMTVKTYDFYQTYPYRAQQWFIAE